MSCLASSLFYVAPIVYVDLALSTVFMECLININKPSHLIFLGKIWSCVSETAIFKQQ